MFSSLECYDFGVSVRRLRSGLSHNADQFSVPVSSCGVESLWAQACHKLNVMSIYKHHMEHVRYHDQYVHADLIRQDGMPSLSSAGTIHETHGAEDAKSCMHWPASLHDTHEWVPQPKMMKRLPDAGNENGCVNIPAQDRVLQIMA